MPLCGIDLQKKPNGFVVDFIALFKKALKINDVTIYYRFYDDVDSLLQALIDGDVDTAFPVSFDLYQVEEDSLYTQRNGSIFSLHSLKNSRENQFATY